MWRDLKRWHGVALITVALVATVWLAATGQLVLYIHPRYIVFTLIMAAIGFALVLASFAGRRRSAEHAEGHSSDLVDADAFPERRSRVGIVASAAATVITAAMAMSLIVLPPATLTAATATQRDINSTSLTVDAQTVADAASASDSAFASFDVLDWSSLLRQTTDPVFFADKPASVVGFVTEDPDDPDDTFYLSRFVVTCCAVDAQPIGVPVHLENWRSTLAVDQWIQVDGGFEVNPSAQSAQLIALVPDEVVPVDQPAEPYIF